MRTNEQRKWLRDNGFTLHRNGKRHELWRHRTLDVTVAVSHGTSGGDPRGWKNHLARMRRLGVTA